MQADLQWLLRSPIAHRGLHDISRAIPENSMAAFTRCVENGVAIELDVHLLADGRIVVFHDDNLLRATGVDRPIKSLTSMDLKNLRLFGCDQRIPLFEEVLSFVAGRVPILVEVKNRGPVGALESSLQAMLATYGGPYAIQSFNPFALKWFKSNAPHVARGQLSGSFREERELSAIKIFILRNMLSNALSAPHFINYEFGYLENVSLRLQGLIGIPILAWTIRSPQEAGSLPRCVRNYMFEGFLPQQASLTELKAPLSA